MLLSNAELKSSMILNFPSLVSLHLFLFNTIIFNNLGFCFIMIYQYKFFSVFCIDNRLCPSVLYFPCNPIELYSLKPLDQYFLVFLPDTTKPFPVIKYTSCFIFSILINIFLLDYEFNNNCLLVAIYCMSAHL